MATSADDHGYRVTLAHLRTCRDRLVATGVDFDAGPDAWTVEQLHAVIALSAAWRQMLMVVRDHAPSRMPVGD